MARPIEKYRRFGHRVLREMRHPCAIALLAHLGRRRGGQLLSQIQRMMRQSILSTLISDGTPHVGDRTDDARDRASLRWLLVICQSSSVILTWPLWQVRQDWPNLPMVDLVQLNFGWLLLASLVIVLIRPLAGVILHATLLVTAIVMDQMRIQPEFISLSILLGGTLPYSGTMLLCRAHLFSMWLYAGWHKLVSPEYIHTFGQSAWQKVLPFLPDALASGLSLSVAICEVTLALMLITPRTRKMAAWLACFLHAGILLYLLALAEKQDRNIAVWPWNLALAVAGFFLIAGWRSSIGASLKQSAAIFRLAGVALIVMPMGYYFGVVDGYLAHCLYSSNTPIAWLESSSRRDTSGTTQLRGPRDRQKYETLSRQTLRSLNVPFPPAHRLYEDFFFRAKKRSDILHIHDPRLWSRRRGLRFRTLTREGEYRDGKKYGQWTYWHSNGRKSMAGEYHSGQETGPWIHWYADGRKEAEGSYRDGAMHGEWTFWYEDGRTVQARYDRGQLVSRRES